MTASSHQWAPLKLGALTIWPPVVLAPMAGVTNYPFRTLCKRFGAGLYVSEMITARPLVDGREKTLKLTDFGPEESIRSLQLYGVDPMYVGLAVQRLVSEGKVDHIDLNFGCPVPKVTRKGGGAAIPLKPKLLSNIIRAAVTHAGDVPITIKFRIGIDEQHHTHLSSGYIAQEEGCKAVGLHARTAAELYDGEARWEEIARLKAHVRHIPVLGNGDIWESHDAIAMMEQTGCDGVIVGRGCLGRPWLFRDLAHEFRGQKPASAPTFGEVREIMLTHARMLCEWLGETAAMRSFRKHSAWYTKGVPSGAALRARLMHVSTFEQLGRALDAIDPGQEFPESARRLKRGKRSGTQKVALPAGYLESLDDAVPPEAAAESIISGG
ncbi:MAG: tRNA dihydrouridine synthase DusB [Myxococcales bacterium]|nr:tRNA dihydrouridine synthase DusB [Myxococcales bacterium]MCB9708981.1 tRNA dihydrouridine synthase DusB [Myxococcales bacterium]